MKPCMQQPQQRSVPGVLHSALLLCIASSMLALSEPALNTMAQLCVRHILVAPPWSDLVLTFPSCANSKVNLKDGKTTQLVQDMNSYAAPMVSQYFSNLQQSQDLIEHAAQSACTGCQRGTGRLLRSSAHGVPRE